MSPSERPCLAARAAGHQTEGVPAAGVGLVGPGAALCADVGTGVEECLGDLDDVRRQIAADRVAGDVVQQRGVMEVAVVGRLAGLGPRPDEIGVGGQHRAKGANVAGIDRREGGAEFIVHRGSPMSRGANGLWQPALVARRGEPRLWLEPGF